MTLFACGRFVKNCANALLDGQDGRATSLRNTVPPAEGKIAKSPRPRVGGDKMVVEKAQCASPRRSQTNHRLGIPVLSSAIMR